jgi:hypothetical protein
MNYLLTWMLVFILQASGSLDPLNLAYKANKLKDTNGTGINWVYDGDGLRLSRENSQFDRTDSLVSSLGYSLLRIPGGYLTRHYDWTKAVGVARGQDRDYAGKLQEVKAGLPEMKFFAAKHGMRIMYTLNINDSPQKSVDLLKQWNELPPTGKTPIEYIELGNEVYDMNPTAPRAQDYSRQVLPLIKAIKGFDPKIKIGALVSNPQNDAWDTTMYSLLKKDIDCVIWHRYVPYSEYNEQDSYPLVLASFEKVENEIVHFRSYIDFNRTPLYITEFNLSFYKDKENQNVSVAPRYNLLLSNYYLLAYMHELGGMAKWSLSNAAWHIMADLNFSGSTVGQMSNNGAVSSVINSWMRGQDSVAIWIPDVGKKFEFAALVGKSNASKVSILVQNQSGLARTISVTMPTGAKLISYKSIFDHQGSMWTSRSLPNALPGGDYRLEPYSLTEFDFDTGK